MPDGQPALVSHQHADDITLHVLQPSDARAALDSSIALFCVATCSQLNVRKSRGFQHRRDHKPTDHNTSWGFLSYDMQAASHQQFTSIYHQRQGQAVGS